MGADALKACCHQLSLDMLTTRAQHTHTHIHKIKHLSVFMQICFHPTRFDATACQHNQWKESNLVSSLCHEAGTSR